MDFLFHEVTEKEKEDIKKQAKSILDDFSKKLSSVDREIKDVLIERGAGERTEGTGKCEDNFSREIMFENAPNKNNTLKGTSDFIIAEKKKW